jgi:hypothetical protein
MGEGISTIVRQLTHDAEAACSEVIDLPGTISTFVKYAAEHQVDPYVTLGVLVESIAHTLAASIPEPKKVETAKGIFHLLLERFAAHGLIC